MTNRDYITKFEAYLLTEKRVSQNTFVAYKRDLAQFATFCDKEQLALKEVTLQNLKQFLHWLHECKLSARSVARKIAALKGFFTFLAEREGFENVARELLVPKIPKKLPEYLTEEEIEQLFQVAEKDKNKQGFRNQVMLYLIYVTGIRVSELVNMKIDQIMFDKGFVRIAGKGGRERMIPIPIPMLSMLKKYVKQYHDAFTDKNGKTDYLFPIAYGKHVKPISRQAFWILLKKIWKKANIKRSLSPHKLRHSFATHMLKRGMQVRFLQEMLGHEHISTVQIYTHVETSFLRDIYDKKHPRS